MHGVTALAVYGQWSCDSSSACQLYESPSASTSSTVSSPYLPCADPVDLAVRDQADRVGRLALLGDDLAGLELLLDEPVGQRLEHVDVVEPAQHRQLAQLLRDDLDPGAGGGERHPPVADGVAQPPVDAVHAAVDLDPGQDLEQPARRDPLHLGDRLGGVRQLAGGSRAEAGLQRFRFIARGRVWICHFSPDFKHVVSAAMRCVRPTYRVRMERRTAAAAAGGSCAAPPPCSGRRSGAIAGCRPATAAGR